MSLYLFEPDGLHGIIWHTNHPMVNSDFNIWYQA
jgi:hypothetical protein